MATDDGPLEALVRTRLDLQAVAEHVLAAALYAATGHIGLRASPGGLATPWFDEVGGDVHRRLRVDGLDLVVEADGTARRQHLDTVGQAARLAGIEPGAPAQVYTPVTALEPDRPLRLDLPSVGRLADLYLVGQAAMADLAASTSTSSTQGSATDSTAQLWPEHFDLSVSLDQVNYGASPGDAEHPEPYLYVGPWTPPTPDGGFWNESFGASQPAAASLTSEQALAFFTQGRDRLAG